MTKVFINPGHAPNGDPDPGACNAETGLRESDVAAIVGRMVAGYLNAAGIETEVLQSDSLEDICSAANESAADLFVSIHCNSAGSSEASGTEVCVHPDSAVGHSLGQAIQDQIVSSLETVDRGLKERVPGVNGLYVLNNTSMPAVLVEMAFISNTDDEKLLANQQDAFARAIARGVTDYEQSAAN